MHSSVVRRARVGAAVVGASAVALIASALPASAHMGVDLGGGTPTAGSSSAFWFRPGHGCDGDATNTLAITVPDGVTNVKAQPKAGWKLTADGKTIIWSRGALPDDQFDDFGVRLAWPKLPAGVASQKFYFQAVQVCNAEIKVTRDGDMAMIMGHLPAQAGETVELFVDGVPLTRHPVVVDEGGHFMVHTSSAKVPEGSDVTAEHAGKMVGNSIAASERWVEIPAPGSTASLAAPAPSVTVVAPVAK